MYLYLYLNTILKVFFYKTTYVSYLSLQYLKKKNDDLMKKIMIHNQLMSLVGIKFKTILHVK